MQPLLDQIVPDCVNSMPCYVMLMLLLDSELVLFDTVLLLYHIDRFYEGEIRNFLNELLAAMKGDDWFDKSDSMTDYFHTAFYNDIKIGDWQKPYKVVS